MIYFYAISMFTLLQEGVFNTVKEGRKDNLAEVFTEWEVREYKDYSKFCVLKNRCLFVTKKHLGQNPCHPPPPPKRA